MMENLNVTCIVTFLIDLYRVLNKVYRVVKKTTTSCSSFDGIFKVIAHNRNCFHIFVKHINGKSSIEKENLKVAAM